LPKFKLLEISIWVSTLIAICMCSLSPASLTFVGDHALLKIVFFGFSTYLWILMIFAFTVIIVHCVVLASFSYLLISLSLFAFLFA
jgi:hypothetical protein